MGDGVPGVLFKYLGLREDGTVRADFFENELFRFTQPHKLNDPVEAMPALVYDRYTERDRGVARERLATNPRIRLGDAADELLERLCLDPFPRHRFDPMTTPLLFPELRTEEERLRATQEHDRGNAVAVLESFTAIVNRTLGVFCLSETATSGSMWWGYGSDGRGIVVGFNASHPFFRGETHQVSYSGRLGLSVNKGVLHLDGVRCVPGEPPLVTIPMLLKKTSDWAHEREWRMVKRLEERDNDRNRPEAPEVCLFRVPADSVRSVAFGLKTKQTDRNRICETLRSDPKWKHVELLQMCVSETDVAGSGLAARSYPP
jgi:hypothetical protein